MSSDAPFQPPRKKINILWLIGGFFVLLIGLFFFQLFGPGPRIIVSPQTTYITKPLGKNGLPDYEQYVLELYREGTTPENNAAALIWPALWPGELGAADYAAVAAELGLKQIPSRKDSLVPAGGNANRDRVAAWLIRPGAKPAPAEGSSDASAVPSSNGGAPIGDDLSLQAQEAADEAIGRAMSRPWTTEQLPPLAKWVEENRKPLDLIVEGSRRPRCYFPSPSLLNNKNETLVAMMLPGTQGVREAGRSLGTRAMWSLGEGRVDDAWADILAIHRIARLAPQGNTLVEQLVAIALGGIACDRTITLLHHGNLSPEQAQNILRDMITLQPHTKMADSIDFLERAMFLDVVTHIATGKADEILPEFAAGQTLFTVVSVDWNIVLRTGNKYYDRIGAAFRLPSHADRKQAMSQIHGDIMQLEQDFQSPATLVAAAFSQSERSDAVAAVMANLFMPALDACMNAQDRANTTLELTRLASALAVYRAEHGAYPETLEDLTPVVLEKLPVDIYNEKPYIYGRDGEGYLLFSPGENGVDDGGSNQQQSLFEGREVDGFDQDEADSLRNKIPADADDMSIRVPRPPFELPVLKETDSE
jgi:hypothetical protein